MSESLRKKKAGQERENLGSWALVPECVETVAKGFLLLIGHGAVQGRMKQVRA